MKFLVHLIALSVLLVNRVTVGLSGNEPEPVLLQSSCLTDCTECTAGPQNGTLCQCDADCETFGDCCGLPQQRPDSCSADANPALKGHKYVCQSIYPDSNIPAFAEGDAYWMVSSCSETFLEEMGSSGHTIEENCTRGSSELPPVTDTTTGVVYRNEFCALCNNVDTLAAWQSNLVCTPYVYQLLEDYDISTILSSDPHIFQRECQPCSYREPNVPSIPTPPRPCVPNIATCRLDQTELNAVSLTHYTQEEYETLVNWCVNGQYDLVFGWNFTIIDGSILFPSEIVSPVYRNAACLECNEGHTIIICDDIQSRYYIPLQCIPNPSNISRPPVTEKPVTEVPCSDCVVELQRTVKEPDNRIPYTIPLTNLRRGLITFTTNTEEFNVTVECPEGEAPVGLECRPTTCPQASVRNGGTCFLPVPGGFPVNVSNVTSKFTPDCNDFVALKDTEYTDLGNNTIQLGDEVVEVEYYDDLGRPLVCPDNFTIVRVITTIYSYRYPEGFLYLTYIGCSLSVIGCALVLITYGLFKELRTLPGKILMNLAVTILMNNLFILVGGPVTQAFPNIDLCTSVAIILHFFFLAQFTWMSVMSFEMTRTFYRAERLIMDTDKFKRNILIVYFLSGWSVPLAITTISIIVNYATDNLVLYGVLEDGTVGSCWINHFESAIIAFVVPLVISMVFNFTMFFIVTVLLCKASVSQAKLKKDQNLPYVRVNIAIFTVTGLTWVFGFVALLVGTTWCWYLFIIFNSTQGFMIYVAFLFSKKTLNLYLGLCGYVPKEKTTKSSQKQQGSNNGTVQSQVTRATAKAYDIDAA